MPEPSPSDAATGTTGEELAQEFLRHRRRLVALAYRMVGSAWDAEDIVEDAMVRWLGVDREEVREPAAFLTTMVTRLALDHLRSARATRERYVGPWLPEPVLTAASARGPLEVLERRETASLATLRMMEALSPPERAVLVLREGFDVPYAEIADVLGISVDHARHHLQRARARLRATADDGERDDAKRFAPDPDAHAALFGRFLDALAGGDFGRLRDLLAEEATAYSDGGGKVRAALHPLVGGDRVARFYAGLRARLPLRDARRLEVNGRPAALVTLGDQVVLLAVEVRGDRIVEVHSVLNPDKLRFLHRQLG